MDTSKCKKLAVRRVSHLNVSILPSVRNYIYRFHECFYETFRQGQNFISYFGTTISSIDLKSSNLVSIKQINSSRKQIAASDRNSLDKYMSRIQQRNILTHVSTTTNFQLFRRIILHFADKSKRTERMVFIGTLY